MERELKAKHERRKDLNHSKFQAIAEKLNGENDKVSTSEYKILSLSLICLGHLILVFSFSFFSY